MINYKYGVEGLSKFTDWEFLLDGELHEFRQLSNTLGSMYFNVYGGIDHYLDCQNDDFRMTTLYCEGETDAQLVWQLGAEIISLFNGASILFERNYRKASIFKLLHKGADAYYMPVPGVFALLGKPKADGATIKEQFVKGATTSLKFPLIHHATENQDVYFILKYLDMPGDWTNYFKLMEAIETFSAENGVELETNNSERRAFTNTANNFSLSGFDSRHGFKDQSKKNNTSSITIEHAHDFVTNMAKTYLRKAYELSI